MVQKIVTKKPYLIEGKLIKKGSSIRIIESEDVEDFPVPEVSANASMPDKTDIEMMRRIRRAKARRMRRVTLDDADNSFPADEIQAMRKARHVRSVADETMMEDEAEDFDVVAMRRARKLRQIRRATKKAEDDKIDEEEEPTDADKVEERKKAIRRIRRMRKIRAMRRAEAEAEETEDDTKAEEPKADDTEKKELRRVRFSKKAEDEVVAEDCKKAEDDANDEDEIMEKMLNK